SARGWQRAPSHSGTGSPRALLRSDRRCASAGPCCHTPSEKVLKLLRNVAKRTDKEQRKLADLVHRDGNHPAIVNAFSQTALLRAAAPAITTVWLIDIIDRATAQQIPEVRNAEGDELLFCTVHYPFADGTGPDDIRLALNRYPELRQENAT